MRDREKEGERERERERTAGERLSCSSRGVSRARWTHVFERRRRLNRDLHLNWLSCRFAYTRTHVRVYAPPAVFSYAPCRAAPAARAVVVSFPQRGSL